MGNAARTKMNALKAEVEQLKVQRAMIKIESPADTRPTEILAEEESKRKAIEEEKQSYKNKYLALKNLKAEIDHMKHILEKSRKQLQKDFGTWWGTQRETLLRQAGAFSISARH